MSKFSLKAFLISPAILAATFVASGSVVATEQPETKLNFSQFSDLSNPEAKTTLAQATPQVDQLLQQIESYQQEGKSINSIEQVTSVTQLRDVQPTDWAFEALRGLVERYGCIAGYPDGTFRGNRALTRYEFAAGLFSCLTQIERLIAAGAPGTDGVASADLVTLQRLLGEFEAELATLGTRVDNLEARLGVVEENQFSTTTKLAGEVVFGVADAFGGEEVRIRDANGDLGGLVNVGDNNTVLQNRVRLNFVTSFTGRDALYTRLDSSNARAFSNLDQGINTYQTSFTDNDIVLGWLAYYFPIGDRVQVYLPAAFPLWQDFVPTISPLFDDFSGASRAVTSFSESSPIYKIGLPEGGGLGLNFELSDSLMISAGYFGGDTANPNEGSGLFEGEYSALGQLTWSPGDRFQLGLTYVNAHFQGSDIFGLGVGTQSAVRPFGLNTKTQTDSYGAQAYFALSDRIGINAFGGLTKAFNEDAGATGEADIYYYGGGLAFPDFGKEGNLAGLFVGVEPYLDSCSGTDCVPGDDNGFHVNAFYKYQLNENISLTPSFTWLTAPGGRESSSDVYLGTLRTTFTF